MIDIPVIMSAPMVLATKREVEVPGTGKTETRRFAWGPRFEKAIDDEGGRPGWCWGVWQRGQCAWPSGKTLVHMGLPPDAEMLIGHMAPSNWQKVKAGDRLWVRESLFEDKAGWLYAADHEPIEMNEGDTRVSAMIAWAHHKERDTAPSIHMPRWASRITLIVAATKLERLQAISERDALAEGVTKVRDGCYVVKGFDYDKSGLCHSRAVIPFSKLWDSLHGDGAWDANPEVVAVSFKPFLTNIDAMPTGKEKPGIPDDILMAG